MTYPKTTFDPAVLERADIYKLVIGLVVPRPIGWVGTISADGVHNLAPYSFFNVVSAAPPTVIFSPGNRGATTGDRPVTKDTLANVRATGEFTLSIVTEELAASMNLTSGEYPPDVDEFHVAGLTAQRGAVVGAPFVAEAKAAMECKVTQIVDVGAAANNSVVFGEVHRIHVDPGVLDGTRVDPTALRALGRMAGAGYTTTVDGYFEMTRPSPAPPAGRE